MQDLLDELQDLREEKVAEINSLKEELRQSFVRAPSLIQRNKELYDQYNARINDLDAHYQQLIATYRHENIRSRNTEPPERFSEENSLGITPFPMLQITEQEPDKEQLINRIENAAERIIDEADTIEKNIKTTELIFDNKYPLAIIG